MNRFLLFSAIALTLAMQGNAQTKGVASSIALPGATMTKQDATTRADALYKAFRAKSGTSLMAVKPAAGAVAESVFEAPSYLASEPYWKVTLPDQTEIHIQDRTGTPVRLINNANETEVVRRVIETQRRGFAAGTDTDLVPLKAEALLRNAVSFKAIFSGSDQFSGEPQIVSSFDARPEARTMYIWKRSARGVPYQDQSLAVTVDAYSGQLIMAGMRNWTSPPANGTENVSKERAQQIAVQKAQEAFGIAAPILLVSKVVIEKNGFWNGTEATKDLSGSYFAWAVTLDVSNKSTRRLIVGVDSETGQVISGELEGTRGPRFQRGKSPAPLKGK